MTALAHLRRVAGRASWLAFLAAQTSFLACAPEGTPPPFAPPSPAPTEAPPPLIAPSTVVLSPTAARAKALVDQMTVEEKAQALDHIWDWSVKKTPAELCEILPLGAGGIERIGLWRNTAETVKFVEELRTCIRKKSRLGIPPFVMDEGVHGFMQKGATSFPAAIALGATWDPALIERIFTAIAREARSRGTNWILGPNLDLAREPRWGRSDEMYSEDPYLVSRLGVAAIRGLQGDAHPFAKDRVLATAKHFAAHSQPESGANGGPVSIGERALRGEFLIPAEAAVREAHVGSVMAAYNEVDGVPGHLNRFLLHQVLRDEWKFPGLVVSDGWGIPRLVSTHHVAATTPEAARKAIQAGIQFEIGDAYRTLPTEVKEGRLPMAVLDQAVQRVLETKIDLGLFEAEPLDRALAERVNNSPEHRALALEAARKGAVLLTNDGVLPLDKAKIKRVAVIGPNAEKAHLGSYSADPGRGISLLDGVRTAAGKAIEVRYARGCNITSEDLTFEGHWKSEVKLPDPKGEQKLIDEAVRIARGTDVAIIAIGENEATSRETWDNHLGDRDSLALLGRQADLVRAIEATKVPTVLVFVNARPLEIGDTVQHSRAAIEAFFLGQETGTALAEILFGDISPSGHLPITFPRSMGQLPAYYYRKPSARGPYLFTDEKPLFPFGHGLSYTKFDHTAPVVAPAQVRIGETARVTFRVTNSGKMRGTDVVQLYVGAKSSSVTRPIRLLRNFARVELAPGESRDVSFEVGPQDLALIDLDMRRTVEPGTYTLEVGSSSAALAAVSLEVTAAK